MIPASMRRALTSLAIAVILAAVTAAVVLAARYSHWDLASALVAAVLVALAVVVIGRVLDALEDWIEQAEGAADSDGRQP